MFFQGSIQEGISTAVGQQKLVLCFVTDENEESQQWETEFLQEETLKDTLETKAIVLRLKAGSDEAGYLSQIFPLPKTPTVVIMKHGELKEYIAAGTSKEDFMRRVSNAFSVSSSASAATSSPVAATSPRVAETTPQAESTPTGTSSTDRSENVTRVLAERAARAEKEKAERQAKEAAAASQKAKGKARADSDTGLAATSSGAQEQADIIKKRKLQASEERRRILERIEHDKEARRLQAAERERKRQEDHAAEQTETSSGAPLKQKTSDHSNAAVQVRLLDGSSIRSRFKASAPFKDIRKWVDQERTDEKLPYSFKQVLTPLPNKTIEAGEEAQSIRDLGLAPSANLLLIPAAAKFAIAYDDAASGNFITRIIRMITGFFVWVLSLVGLGGQQPAGDAAHPERSGASSTSSSTPAAAAKARRTRGPGDWQRDQQLYNGNSLNFEPRPDEDEK